VVAVPLFSGPRSNSFPFNSFPFLFSAGGLVVAVPLFGGPRSNSKANRALFRSVLAATDALTIAWLLGQYAFQVGNDKENASGSKPMAKGWHA